MGPADSLSRSWKETLEANGARIAVTDCATGRSVSFDQLERLAAGWVDLLGRERLPTCSCVVVRMPHSIEFLAVFLATLRLRLVLAPLDRSHRPNEVEAVMKQIGAKIMISDNVRGPQRLSFDSPKSNLPDQTVLLKLTSGSTGAPKGIALDESQLISDARNICSTMDIRPDDLNFGVIPLAHSYGFDNLVLPLIMQGTALALLDEGLPRAIAQGIASTRATVFPAVPFLLQTLSSVPGPLPEIKSLRTVLSAGAPLTADVYNGFRNRFGLKIHQFYGSSECGGITFERDPPDEFIPGCVGTPMENVAVDIDQDGRVRVRGANVAHGYFPPAAAEEENVLHNGMFLTRDLGRLDERGRLHLVGRMTSFINVAGRKVNPAEVERCVQQISDVESVVVIGFADHHRNESIAAFVVPRQGKSMEAEVLVRHCRTHLAPWKVPRFVKFLDAMPMNERGKLDREELKKTIAGAASGEATLPILDAGN